MYSIKAFLSAFITVTILSWNLSAAETKIVDANENESWNIEKELLKLRASVAEQNTKICHLEKDLIKLTQKLLSTEHGSANEQPQEGVTEEMTTVSAPHDTGYVFSGALSSNEDYGNHEIPIIYNVIHSNVGNAYSTRDGKFHVKVSGLYELAIGVAAAGDAVHVVLEVNGASATAATALEYNTGSNLIFKQLQAGDLVSVRNSYGKQIRGDLLTTFSVRLLPPY